MQTSKKEIKTTKRHLKTMSHNGNNHKLRTTRRVFKYGAVGFKRNIWLSIAAIMVMTVTLIVLFFTVVTMRVLSSTAESMRQKIDITLFFKPGTEEDTLKKIADIVYRDSNTRSVEYSTSEQEYRKVLEENSGDSALLLALDDSDMKAQILSNIQSILRIKVYEIDQISSLQNIVSTDETILANLDTTTPPSYDTNRTEIETVNSWARIAQSGGIILSIVFLAISILVIFNTIRMAIFSRREEIYMMKLVGADNSFIRGPFLIEAQLSGVISGIIAAILGYVGFHLAAPHLESYGINISDITNILETERIAFVYASTILTGLTIGTISAYLAIRKYLKRA